MIYIDYAAGKSGQSRETYLQEHLLLPASPPPLLTPAPVELVEPTPRTQLFSLRQILAGGLIGGLLNGSSIIALAHNPTWIAALATHAQRVVSTAASLI